MSSSKRASFVSGILQFTPKKILLLSGNVSYYVRLPRGGNTYVHGDRVNARITRVGEGSHLSEVEILSREGRSREVLLAEALSIGGKWYLEILRSLGNYRSPPMTLGENTEEGDIFLVRFSSETQIQIIKKFANTDAFDREEQILFFLSGIRLEFSPGVLAAAEQARASETYLLDPSLESKKHQARRDFRDRPVFTIDGADAKDLDDAISVHRDASGKYHLTVHIADVAEYIREDSVLDKEALLRGTSVYTPGKVVPMLPEALSNDVCSLHPGAPKLTLSCSMVLDVQGQVLETEIVEGIIESQYRGVYEIIEKYHREKNTEELPRVLMESINYAYELYDILDARRTREGKILFETTETAFVFEKGKQGVRVPSDVHPRSRVDAHQMIEEFMVLANEEVAKWCDQRGIPFLSRVHGIPSQTSMTLIREILRGSATGAKSSHQKHAKSASLEPIEIRRFLDTVDANNLYRYSRLLLPRMAKALYADRKDRHFGLALEYYAHFTSPIRRYPDLQVHRIIKEELQGKLTPERKKHYQNILKKVARHSSERERNAEDTERAFDALYSCRYMIGHIGETFSGRVSGIAEFAYFVELENGIEATVYLARNQRYTIDAVQGVLIARGGKKYVMIGDVVEIRITEVMMDERRIIAER